MSKQNKHEEIKLKSKFLINIDSRTDEKKMKFSKWLQAQSNPQNSFLSLIEHCIDRFGYADITDHDVAKRLYQEILYFNDNNNEEEVNKKVVYTKPVVKPIEEKKKLLEETVINNEEENDIEADLSSF